MPGTTSYMDVDATKPFLTVMGRLQPGVIISHADAGLSVPFQQISAARVNPIVALLYE